MNALTRLTDFHAYLLTHVSEPNADHHPTLKHWLVAVNTLGSDLEQIQPAIQQIVDATDALALTVQLLDADHRVPLDADRMRCLLEPLHERLQSAIERLRQVI